MDSYCKSVKLGKKTVGDNYPCYTIAEIGGHFSTFDEAKVLIDSAIEVGVDAIKFQTLEAETVTTKNNFFDMKATGHISQFELLRKFEISKTVQKKIVEYTNQFDTPIFSAPSHIKDLETIKELELPIIKIGSDLSCHVPLLREISSTGKPIILSTGMCTLEEVQTSVDNIIDCGNCELILMHCVSNYPSNINELNLKAISTMKNKFHIPVGFSDHTIGIDSTIASVVMGANIIERHFYDTRNTPSPDNIHALTKDEFLNLINKIRYIEKSFGDGIKLPTDSEKKNMLTNKVSIVAIKEIKKGTIITSEMIDIRRPGTGIQPKFFNQIIGRTAKETISKEQVLDWKSLI